MDAVVARVREDLANALLIGVTQKQPSRFAPDLAEFLASFANRRSINNRQRLLDMLSYVRIKQRLVRILKIAHESIFIERCWQLLEPLPAALPLFLDCPNVRRQQPMESKRVSLAFRKSSPLVQPGVIKQLKSRQAGLNSFFPAGVCFQVSHLHAFRSPEHLENQFLRNLCSSAVIKRSQRNRLVSAKSRSSPPRPLSTALRAHKLNPIAWSSLIVGGMESSIRFTTMSTSAGPSC